MKRRAKNTIVTIDLYNNRYFRYINGKYKALKKLKFTKKDILVSYISNSDLIIEPMDFSSSIASDDIINIATDRAYEELRLDTATKYKIFPIKTALRGSLNKYQTIISDESKLKKKLEPVVSKRDIIDYIIPAPLLYKVLYHNKKLDRNGSDLFIYFGQEDTFVTFYHKGEYLYSKSIKYSLTYMYDRMCQLAQEVFLTREQFFELLKNDGLRSSEGRVRDLIIQVFNECFLNLNDVLIYTKRVYDIENINKAYVGFSCGYLAGIDAYVSNYLNLETTPISSLYSKLDPAKTIGPLTSLMLMNALALQDGFYDVVNLTPYPRPQPLSKRPAGKLLLGSVVVASLFLIPVAYYYVKGFSYQVENKSLETKERKLNIVVTNYKRKLKERREKLKALTEANKKLSDIYKTKKGELDQVYDKKFNYKLKSEQLALVTEVLNSFDIKSKKITISDDLYSIELEAKDNKEITSFIKKLVSKFNKKIINVDINNIKYDSRDGLYKGILKVEFARGEE